MRKKLSLILTCMAVEGYLLYGAMAVGSTGKWAQLESYWDKLLSFVYILVLIKILVDRNSWLDWLTVIGFAGLTELTRITTQTNAVIWFATGVILAKEIDLKKVLQVDLSGRFFIGILLMVLPMVGIYPSYSVIRDDGRLRTCFGWAHPNELGLFFLMICILWFYFRFEKWNWKDTVAMLCSAAIIDYYANSRMSELCIVGLAFLGMAGVVGRRKLSAERRIKIYALAGYMVLFGGLIGTWGLFHWNIEGTQWQYKLPDTLASRLIYAHNFWAAEGFSFAGQMFDETIYHYLDMMYAYLSLNMGFLVLLMFMVLSVIAIRGAWKQRDEKMLLIFFIFACYSLVEHEHFKMLSGFYPLLLGYYFWPFLDEIRGWIQVKTGFGGHK